MNFNHTSLNVLVYTYIHNYNTFLIAGKVQKFMKKVTYLAKIMENNLNKCNMEK